MRDELYDDVAMAEGLVGVGIGEGELMIYVASADAEAKLRETVAVKALQVPIRFVISGATWLP